MRDQYGRSIWGVNKGGGFPSPREKRFISLIFIFHLRSEVAQSRRKSREFYVITGSCEPYIRHVWKH